MKKNKKLKIGGPLKKAADKLNAAALPGERLAYINPAEARMLKAAGGAGVPFNESGVPAYPWFIPALIGAAVGGLAASASKKPTQPSVGATSEEGMEAEAKMFPINQRLKWMAQEGQKGSVRIGDEDVDVDFTGMGWREKQAQLTEQEKIIATKRSALDLELQQKFGSAMNQEYLKNLKEMNPQQWKLKEEANLAILDQLHRAQKGEIDPKSLEKTRGAQTARGNYLGSANIAQEVKLSYFEKQSQLNQAIAQAQHAALGQPVQAQMARFAPGQTGYAPQPLGLVQGAMGMAQSNYQTASANYSNPWMEGLGMAVGLGSAHALAGGFMQKAPPPPGPVQGPGGTHFPIQGGSGLAYTTAGYL